MKAEAKVSGARCQVSEKARCGCGAVIANLPGTRWHPTSICEECFYKLTVDERRQMANGLRRKV